MNNFIKKIVVTLTSVFMASSMVLNVSAASSNGTSCSGNNGSSNVYSVSSNVNTYGCLTGTDVNSLFSYLNSLGCSTSSDCSTTDEAGATNNCTLSDSADQSCSAAAEQNSSCGVTNAESDCVNVESEQQLAVEPDTADSNNVASTTDSCASSEVQNATLSNICKTTESRTFLDWLNEILAKCGINLNTDDVTENSGSTPTETSAPSTGADTAETQPADNSNTGTTDSGNIDNLSFEQQVVTLVNEQRAANGLAPLTLSEELSNAARVKSQDMHDNNYFSHTSPTYGSPFDMLTSFGISYRAAGENIAMGYATPEAVMTAWMNSAGHRANILNASYTQIGVGYVSDGNYWTQEFIG